MLPVLSKQKNVLAVCLQADNVVHSCGNPLHIVHHHNNHTQEKDFRIHLTDLHQKKKSCSGTWGSEQSQKNMLSSRVVERQRVMARQSMHNRVAMILHGTSHATTTTTPAASNPTTPSIGPFASAVFDDGSTPTVSLLMTILRRNQNPAAPASSGAQLLSSPVVPDTSFKQNPRASSASRQSAGPSPMSQDDDDGLGLLSPASGGGAVEFQRVESFASPSPAASPDRIPTRHEAATAARQHHNAGAAAGTSVGTGVAKAATSPLSSTSIAAQQQVTFIGPNDGEDVSAGSPFKTQFLPSALMALTTDNISRSRYNEEVDSEDDVAQASNPAPTRSGGEGTVSGRGRAAAAKPTQQRGRGGGGGGAAVATTALITDHTMHTSKPTNRPMSAVQLRLQQRRLGTATTVGSDNSTAAHPQQQSRQQQFAAHGASGHTSLPALSSIMNTGIHDETELTVNENDSGGLLSPPNAVDTSYASNAVPEHHVAAITSQQQQQRRPSNRDSLREAQQPTQQQQQQHQQHALTPAATVSAVAPLKAAKTEVVDAGTEVDRFTRLVSNHTVEANQSATAAQVDHMAAQIEEEVRRVQIRDVAIHKTTGGNGAATRVIPSAASSHMPAAQDHRAAPQEKQELALHLYSLKQQVVMLSHMTAALMSAAPQQQQQQGGVGGGGILLQSSADFGASLRNTARRSGGGRQQQVGNGPVTVHVVRDYDGPVVPYRKSAVAAAQQQQTPHPSSKPPISGSRAAGAAAILSSVNASSGQYSSDFVTTAGSVSLPRRSYASGGNYSASIGEDSFVMASSSWGGR
jgi:hypothetical protein